MSGNGDAAVNIFGAGATNNQVLGNYIGTDVNGTVDVGNAGWGVIVNLGAANNTIGGTLPGSRNVISGNQQDGVIVAGAMTAGNLLLGNYIGTDAGGTFDLGNTGNGVYLNGPNNIVGGAAAGAGNVISGNSGAGVRVDNFGGHQIQGNLIGTNATGDAALPNLLGIWLAFGSPAGVLIGGTVPGAGNVISGNAVSGIELYGGVGTQIQANYIGVNGAGTAAVPNLADGILIHNGFFSHDHTIGGNVAGAGNIISGNLGSGIEMLQGTYVNVVTGNLIGTAADGAIPLGNHGDGISLLGYYGTVHDIRIGTDGHGVSDPLERNIISGNGGAGIGTSTDDSAGVSLVQDTIIAGNLIGTDITATQAVGNLGDGVRLAGRTTGTLLGGTFAGAGNVVGGNQGDGIDIDGAAATGNSIFGNHVGVTADGLGAVSNVGAGVRVIAAAGTVIGGLAAGQPNAIGYNLGAGLRLFDAAAAASAVRGNLFVNNLGGGIDVGSVGVTVNDLGDVDGFLNFPVITAAEISGGELIVAGFSRSGVALDLYLSTPALGAFAGYGQGQPYLASLVEGSAADQDSTTGSYGPGPVGGVVVGHDATSRFRFVLPLAALPPEVQTGSLLTSVALGSTSEFGNAVTIGLVAGNGAPFVFAGDDQLLGQGDRLEQNGQIVGVDTLEVTVQNESPEATFNVFSVTSPAQEGQLVTLRGQFTDPGVNDTHSVAVDWGDGSPRSLATVDQATRTLAATHVYPDDNPTNTALDQYRIQVFVTDNFGATDSTPLGLFLEEVRNVRPGNLSVNLSSSVISENDVVNLTGSFTDVGLLDSHEVSVDWGDGSPRTQLSLPPSGGVLRSLPPTQHRYLDDPASGPDTYTITIEVTDDEPLAPVTLTRAVTVNNVAPQNVQIMAPAFVEESGVAAIHISFHDPGTFDTHRVAVNWGDGADEWFILPRGVQTLPALTHRYRNDAPGDSPYTIAVTVADDDAPLVPGSAAASLLVVNIPSVMSPIAIQGPAVIAEGDVVTISGSFTDQGPDDRHSVTVAWGDGTVSSASVNSSAGTCTAMHRYVDDRQAGTSTSVSAIVVTIDDHNGTRMLSARSALDSAPRPAAMPSRTSRARLRPSRRSTTCSARRPRSAPIGSTTCAT